MSDDAENTGGAGEHKEEEEAAGIGNKPHIIINPDDYPLSEPDKTESGEVKTETTGTAETAPETTDKSGQYSEHDVAKAINRMFPPLINNLVLTCPECDKLTQEEMEKSGLGAAFAWYADKKLPNLPKATPELAILTAAFALMGYTALHHPVIKSKLPAIATAGEVQATEEEAPLNTQAAG